MKIPFFNYPNIYHTYEQKFNQVLNDVGRRGAFIMQKDLNEFEARIAKYCGAKFAVGVGNATDGLQLGLLAGGINLYDEIIFSSHTMIATASAIHFAGAIPIPVEAGKDHLIDPVSIEASITKKTRAIVTTQLNGRTSNMDKIKIIADKYGLDIYEDAAQALGSKFRGKCAGTFGIASCISFYPAKILGCLGDGGLVMTNDEEIHRKLLLMRDHGRNQEGDIELWGLNSRLDNLQAAFLNMQFNDYKKVIDRRREIASLYQERLGNIEEILLPPAPGSDSDHFDIYQNYEIEADNRDNLKKYLADNGVGTLIQWGGTPVHKFKKLGFKQKLPFTENLFNRMLMIPMNMSITDDNIDYISDCIKEFYK